MRKAQWAAGHRRRRRDSGGRQWGNFRTAPFPSCAAVGKLLGLLPAYIPDLQKKENNDILARGVL